MKVSGLFVVSLSTYLKSLSFSFQICDDVIYLYFTVEMFIKMLAMGIAGKGCYLSETWNRLDFFIVMAGEEERPGVPTTTAVA